MKHAAIISACVVAISVGFAAAWWQGDCTHVARAGAAVVAIAILSEGWIILNTRKAENMPFWRSSAGHTAARFAIVLIAIGTLIQGYGDFLANAVLSCS